MERENFVAYFLAFGLFCFHMAFIHIKTGENWRIRNGRGAHPHNYCFQLFSMSTFLSLEHSLFLLHHSSTSMNRSPTAPKKKKKNSHRTLTLNILQEISLKFQFEQLCFYHFVFVKFLQRLHFLLLQFNCNFITIITNAVAYKTIVQSQLVAEPHWDPRARFSNPDRSLNRKRERFKVFEVKPRSNRNQTVMTS